jgi:NAD(P)-dependent dehydrogenase (short-subunit alcohol dehydrogenase family)
MVEGKVAVITGGSSGMGRETAIELARQGAAGVVVADIDAVGGGETVSLVESAGGRAEFVRCDLRERADIEALMTKAVDLYGGIDILHNNAGVIETELTTDAKVDTLPEDVWDTIYEVNLRGAWLCTKFAAPHLRRAAAGAIVNMGASVGQTAFPMTPAYQVSKAGLVALTRATALDLADDGVRCNCVSPGAIRSKIVEGYIAAAEDKESIMKVLTASHLVPRLGEPEEVAKLVCFLASDDAAFITGALFTIDGGSLAWRGVRDD